MTAYSAIANFAFATGTEKDMCPQSDELTGRLIHRAPSSQSPPAVSSPLFLGLEEILRTGNRRQKAVALIALRDIGINSELTGEHIGSIGVESEWLREALTSIECDAWSPPDVFSMWSPETRARMEDAGGAKALSFLIEQMIDHRLQYPEGVFSYALHNRGIKNVLTVETVARLLPVLQAQEFSDRTRLEAVRFVDALGDGANIFEDALVQLYRSTNDDELWFSTGNALVSTGSVLGADVLADFIEDHEMFHWAWSQHDCKYPPANPRLVSVLAEVLESWYLAARIAAAEALGCLGDESSIDRLSAVLDEPFWSLQKEAALALRNFDSLPRDVEESLENLIQTHWSSQVRAAAAPAIPVDESDEEYYDLQPVVIECFHRCAREHGLPVCHGSEPGSGRYVLPWIGEFDVQWTDARVHDLPKGFPIVLNEMRERKGYGTNTFLPVPDGWLFGLDLWHYDGDLGFVSMDGEVQRFAPRSAHAAVIVETQFGITSLGQDVFHGGDGGSLAVIDLDDNGGWTYTEILELPSEAFGYAFAPDGTLLVKDAYGAVAINTDRSIWPLECPG